MHQTSDLNDNYMGSGFAIQKAIQKYGVEQFNKEILHIFDNEQEMRNKEKELVIISENTYNLCEGGGCPPLMKGALHPLYGKKHSEETLLKMRLAKLGKKMSEESKKKMSIAGRGKFISEEQRKKTSAANKGQIPWSKGKKLEPFSLETKQKMSLAAKGKPKPWRKGIPLSLETRQKISSTKKLKFNLTMENII